ncbi:hypothetical protein JRO89_XS02G0094500 [Xanthoceras sorbifolium]|uniref:Small EDRK-rich factor-like N-terminal domain-containing protein n=1 Tax=Xanthoceras sorbifolium TaxID=99658 RepID=A0ABQ8IFQ1_9ROSI|nr:hypothetical protein JRO89_XS02G0094500 [Xanthoceras sorbifolium]
MGGGKGQKARMASEKNMEKQRAVKGLLLLSEARFESNKKAMNIQLKFRLNAGHSLFQIVGSITVHYE